MLTYRAFEATGVQIFSTSASPNPRLKGRAAHDRKKAQRNAEQADTDAEFAIDFAYAAIEEAEYAVLDSPSKEEP